MISAQVVHFLLAPLSLNYVTCHGHGRVSGFCFLADRTGPSHRRISNLGCKADICTAIGHVRYAPESGHVRCNCGCPIWAKSGHSQLFDHLVGAQHKTGGDGIVDRLGRS